MDLFAVLHFILSNYGASPLAPKSTAPLRFAQHHTVWPRLLFHYDKERAGSPELYKPSWHDSHSQNVRFSHNISQRANPGHCFCGDSKFELPSHDMPMSQSTAHQMHISLHVRTKKKKKDSRV